MMTNITASKMADSIISELKKEIGNEGDKFDTSTPIKANKAIAKAITDYLKQNTQVAISYGGIITATGIPDPLVADMFSITGNCAPAMGTNFDAWLMQLVLNIQTGFQLQTVGNLGLVCGTPTLCFMGTPFVGSQTILNLKNVHESNKEDPLKAIWYTICNAICTWLNSLVVPTPFSCTNPALISTGPGFITKITVL